MKIIFNVKGHLSLPIHDLKPFQGDLKKLSEENHNKLRGQIIDDGFNFCPHVWKCDKHWYILDGHQRVYALKQLAKEGYEFVDNDGNTIDGVPVNPVYADDINSAKRKVLQAISQYGKLDTDGFKEFVVDVDFDLDDFDFPDFEVPELDMDDDSGEGHSDPDNVPEVDDNPYGVQRGDIWQLGNHRLMCGDSTDKGDVDRLMCGEKADMVFTDPPYGIGEAAKDHSSRRKLAKPTIYKRSNWDNSIPDKCIFEYILSLQTNTIIFGGNYFTEFLPPSGSWVFWDKDMTGDFSDGELAWTNYKNAIRKYKQTWNGMIREGETGKRVHPTQKPIALAEWCFKNYGDPKSVLDLFLGSGSTLIACEKTNRKCFGLEIDPHYVSIIIKRWEEYTKLDALKIG